MDGFGIFYFSGLATMAGLGAHFRWYGVSVYFALMSMGFLVDRVFG